jgi:hypothetical protein
VDSLILPPNILSWWGLVNRQNPQLTPQNRHHRQQELQNHQDHHRKNNQQEPLKLSLHRLDLKRSGNE